MTILTYEDRLFIIRKAKKGEAISVDGKVDTWEEDGVKMGAYSALHDGHFPTLYRGTYEDCLRWKEEAFRLWDEARAKYREKELEEYRSLGIDI